MEWAYEIDDRNEGYYVVVTFSTEPSAQMELERTLNLADEVLRHKVTVVPQKREQKHDRKRERQLAASPASADGGDATSQGE